MFAEENGLHGDPRIKAISDAIRVVPHFPKPGIMFQDITTLLLDPKAFRYTIDIFVNWDRDKKISVVAVENTRELELLRGDANSSITPLLRRCTVKSSKDNHSSDKAIVEKGKDSGGSR